METSTQHLGRRDIEYLVRMVCAECGELLPERTRICRQCSPIARPDPDADAVRALIRRAKGHLVIGSLMLPWVFSILAWQNAQRAHELAEAVEQRDPGLLAKIRHIRWLSLTAVVLVHAVTVLLLMTRSA